MPFVTNLIVMKLAKPGRAKWRLIEPLRYRDKVTGEEWTVPAGEETDFASVPRIPLAFLLAGDTAHEPAALHDRLYRTGEVSRKRADELFLQAMKEQREPGWRSQIMYGAVRIFGGGYYKEQEIKRAAQEDIYVG